MAAQPDFQRRLESIEELLGRIEGAADPSLRAAARELIELVMDLHGTALGRMIEMFRAGGEPGLQWLDKLGRDDLISSLLVLYGLHPETLEVRVERAIEKLRPSLKKRGGDVELLSAADGITRLRLRGNGHAAPLKQLVEGALYQAAPDISSLVIEGPEESAGFVPLEMLRSSAAPLTANGRGRSAAGNGGL